MLVVQALSELDDAGRCGGAAGCGGRGHRRRDLVDDRLGGGDLDDGLRLGRSSGSRRGAGLELGDARLQLLVLGDGLAPLDDDLVEEVIDLVRVETLLEAHVLELLRDDVFGSQSHCCFLFRC